MDERGLREGLDESFSSLTSSAPCRHLSLHPRPVPAWQEAMLNKLPTLSEGAEDKAGQVFYVHSAQALVHLYGQITGLADAACQMVTGNYEAATAACVRAVQGHRHHAHVGQWFCTRPDEVSLIGSTRALRSAHR